MATKTRKTSKSQNTFRATKNYKLFMPNRGLLTENQHNKLLKGDSVDLSVAPDKQIKYLIANNLISKGE